MSQIEDSRHTHTHIKHVTAPFGERSSDSLQGRSSQLHTHKMGQSCAGWREPSVHETRSFYRTNFSKSQQNGRTVLHDGAAIISAIPAAAMSPRPLLSTKNKQQHVELQKRCNFLERTVAATTFACTGGAT